ncbi:hypothetical protein AQUCO_03200019v1 [Aquilegia coerulea]|uniref:Uncharacterized protein n=1 Tax=Aquilegia coerulea TaxID=218851 RepID=A0A2G5CZR3_AQUCA|nr:hypothetical protein AQUCO_03200019v1 [Aquilegia coerulea]
MDGGKLWLKVHWLWYQVIKYGLQDDDKKKIEKPKGCKFFDWIQPRVRRNCDGGGREDYEALKTNLHETKIELARIEEKYKILKKLSSILILFFYYFFSLCSSDTL